MRQVATEIEAAHATSKRANELFQEQQLNIAKHADRMFAVLMLLQWVAGLVAAVWISPHTWAGTESRVHLHVWAALWMGGAITLFPVILAWKQSGNTFTRHVVAVGQMLMSALLIHLTGGRIETHFHVFGSLAFLAFYRDWRVLVSASVVVYVDHLLRGIFWPQSVYGVLVAPVWRSLEHAGWVMFEVTFLMISIRQSLREMFIVAERQAKLEVLNANIERTVAERTAELTRENIERRQAEEKLIKSQAQLAQAQQIAHLGSWEWDIAEDSVSWSEETARLYAFEPEAIGSSMEICLQRIHPDDLERVKQVLAEALRTQAAFDCDHRVILPDGRERLMQGRGEVVTNEHGVAIKMVGTAQDVTETKQAEEALHRSEEKFRQSQKMEAVGRLAGGVAHDFNNLLTVISGYCDLLLGQVRPNDPLRRNTEEIHKAAQRAASLTRQLLAFSRKQVLQPKVLDLNEVVTGMEAMVRRLIGEDIELRTSLKRSLGKITADRGQLEQVIMNLVVNARDAMPRGGKILIETDDVALDQKILLKNRELDPGNYVLLAISDTGVGMSETVKAHLFEPFFTTKGPGQGTGLGLATSYGIVKQSGGDIRVYSELNRGTAFRIYFPCVGQATVSEGGSIPEPLPCKGSETLLLVEDEESVRELAASVLRDCGYIVHEAEDGAQGMQIALGEHSPKVDLIVSDIIMPRMGGRDMAETIRLRHPEVKVLFISGYTNDALADSGVLSPGIAFMEKPFSPKKLAERVRAVLDAPPAYIG